MYAQNDFRSVSAVSRKHRVAANGNAVGGPEKHPRQHGVIMSRSIHIISPPRNRRREQGENEQRNEDIMDQLKKVTKTDFPRLKERVYIKPPVHFNRVSYRLESLRDCSPIKVPVPATQMSDVREDECKQRIHSALTRLFHGHQEGLFVVFDLDFDNYLNDPRNILAAEAEVEEAEVRHREIHMVFPPYIPVPIWGGSSDEGRSQAFPHYRDRKLPNLAAFPRPRDKAKEGKEAYRGRYDVLILHPRLGVMIFDVRAIGDVFGMSDNLQTEDSQREAIRKKLRRSLEQLDKEEDMFRYLCSDLLPRGANLPVFKGLMLPNLDKQTVRDALRKDPDFRQLFCRCLVTEDPHSGVPAPDELLESALAQCIFRDALPPAWRSVDLTDDHVTYLKKTWWLPLEEKAERKVPTDLGGIYEAVIARFCGPGTSQYVSTSHNPKADVSTLHKAVLQTARCFSENVLTEEQVSVLKEDPKEDLKEDPGPYVYITGPPATAKSVILQLKAEQWLRQGRTVFVVSLWKGSEAASRVLYNKIKDSACPRDGQPRLSCLVSKDAHFTDVLNELVSWVGGQRHEPSAPRPPPMHVGDLPSGDLEEDSGCCYDIDRYHRALSPSGPPVLLGGSQLFHYTHRGGSGKNQGRTAPAVFAGSGQHLNGKTHSNGWRPQSPGHASMRTPNGEDSKRVRLCLVIDEAPWFLSYFVDKVQSHLRDNDVDLKIWAASTVMPDWKPASFHEVVLTKSLRCPPVVVQEMMKGSTYSAFNRSSYSRPDAGDFGGMPSPTDGPPVKRIRHTNHKAERVWDCSDCGMELASFLTDDLKIGVKRHRYAGQSDQPAQLTFSDVLVSGYLPSLDQQPSSDNGFLGGLKQGKVRVDVIRGSDDPFPAERLAAPSDVDCVQVAEPERVLGLERPVVVVIGATDVRMTYPRFVDPWYDVIARCTAQLVIVGQVELCPQASCHSAR